MKQAGLWPVGTSTRGRVSKYGMTLAGVNHSSGSDSWGTPISFFDRLRDRFDFRLDACAEPWSAKCDRFYTKDDDGLSKAWESWTWCNPPYSNILGWYRKASEEALLGNSSAVLTFARTDTRAFHQYALKASEIVFLKGRLKFIDPATKQPGNSAPAPSMLVIFDSYNLGSAKFSAMSAKDI